MLVVVVLRIGLKLLYNEVRLCHSRRPQNWMSCVFVQSLRKTGIFDMILFAIQISNQKEKYL